MQRLLSAVIAAAFAFASAGAIAQSKDVTTKDKGAVKTKEGSAVTTKSGGSVTTKDKSGVETKGK